MANNLISEELQRDIYTLEDENNPETSKINLIYPRTVLDQVFDDLDPNKKTLREILKELEEEVIKGGIANITFPVTSVNNRQGNVILDKAAIGLSNVDNTKDIDKPLSQPQREAINNILKNFNFNINLSDINNHIENFNNPHKVSLSQLNSNNELSDFVSNELGKHAIDQLSHIDIRRNLAKLWIINEQAVENVDNRVSNILSVFNDHLLDNDPHPNQFLLKEDKFNKALSFDSKNIDHTKYPSTQAVSNFVERSINDFKNTLPNITNWIDSISCVENRNSLPTPGPLHLRKAFFIRKGETNEVEFAICVQNPNKTFSWDIFAIGAYYKFNPNHFIETIDGLSFNIMGLITAFFGDQSSFNSAIQDAMDDYINNTSSNKFLTTLNIVPGTMDGCIRFYINNDPSTMSDDIRIPGLKKYAFMDKFDDRDLNPLSISNQHIQSRAITNRNLDGRVVEVENMKCSYGYMIGNIDTPGDNFANEVSLMRLADMLRPLIGGFPDPNVPGGTPWQNTLDNLLQSPHLYTPNFEYKFYDNSYVMRFTGTVSAIENYNMKILISSQITLGDYCMIDAGGVWVYQSVPKKIAILGGTNLTGHTFGTISMDENGIYFESISIGARERAPYDFWVRYVKPNELEQLRVPEFITPDYSNQFTPVTTIDGVIEYSTVDKDIVLSYYVLPATATNNIVKWEMIDNGTTHAILNKNRITNVNETGKIRIKATIKNGLTLTDDFIKEFTINII